MVALMGCLRTCPSCQGWAPPAPRHYPPPLLEAVSWEVACSVATVQVLQQKVQVRTYVCVWGGGGREGSKYLSVYIYRMYRCVNVKDIRYMYKFSRDV